MSNQISAEQAVRQFVIEEYAGQVSGLVEKLAVSQVRCAQLEQQVATLVEQLQTQSVDADHDDEAPDDQG